MKWPGCWPDSHHTASGVKFLASGEPGDDPIPAGDAGPSSEAVGYHTKSPGYLNDGVTWAVITVLDGDAAPAWISNPYGRSLADYEATTVKLESCDGSFTGFLGGIHTPKPRNA